MKSRIYDKPREKILIYGFSEEKAALFEQTARKLRIDLAVLPSDSAGQQIGYLAGFGGFSDSGIRTEAAGECVIFSCMEGKSLNRTLDEMKANGLGGIPLKAAITAHNQKMTLSELMEELAKEHRQLHPEEGGKENV